MTELEMRYSQEKIKEFSDEELVNSLVKEAKRHGVLKSRQNSALSTINDLKELTKHPEIIEGLNRIEEGMEAHRTLDSVYDSVLLGLSQEVLRRLRNSNGG